jgi:hypothetical protein
MVSSRLAMIHDFGALRRLARMIRAVGGPLAAIAAASLPDPASAGGSAAPDPRPALRGSYCDGPDQDLTPPSRAGCARISGYVAAGGRFGPDERIGGRPDLFAPIDEPAIAGGRPLGVTIVGAPLGGSAVLAPARPGDIAR